MVPELQVVPPHQAPSTGGQVTQRISTKVSTLTRERENGRCALCALGLSWGHRHHRLPGQIGGRFYDPTWNDAANIVRVHHRCHDYIESHREMSYLCGWLVPANAVPAEMPFLYGGVGWVLLDSDGGFTVCEPPDAYTQGHNLLEGVRSEVSSFTAKNAAAGGVAHPSPPAASLSGLGRLSPAGIRAASAILESERASGLHR